MTATTVAMLLGLFVCWTSTSSTSGPFFVLTAAFNSSQKPSDVSEIVVSTNGVGLDQLASISEKLVSVARVAAGSTRRLAKGAEASRSVVQQAEINIRKDEMPSVSRRRLINSAKDGSAFVTNFRWQNPTSGSPSDPEGPISILSAWADKEHVPLRTIAVINYPELDARSGDGRSTTALVHLPYTPPSENVAWADLYPPGPDRCPELPMAKWANVPFTHDALIVRVPCSLPQPGWAKDVTRHHLLLSAAKAASKSGKTHLPVLVLSGCRPTPNLFHCRDLITYPAQPQPQVPLPEAAEAKDAPATSNAVVPVGQWNLSIPALPPLSPWLYKLHIHRTRTNLRMPPGGCIYAPPKPAVPGYPRVGDVAYVSLLHSSHNSMNYVCGALALARSIRESGSEHDMVMLLAGEYSAEQLKALKGAGWKLRHIEPLANPYPKKKGAYNNKNFSKLRIWQLTQYTRLLFIDADLLVLNNMDSFFSFPEISARNNEVAEFNSGVMVVEPSECQFQVLLENINIIVSKNGGDQGFLNEIFTWWHRIPDAVNFLKHVAAKDGPAREDELRFKEPIFSGAPGAPVYALHYLGHKPWNCYKDFDCNWLYPKVHAFANDVAHATWWKFHDSMPPEQQKFCLLPGGRKSAMEAMRLTLMNRGYDEKLWGWNETLQDPRQDLCVEGDRLCSNWRTKVQNYIQNAKNDVPMLAPVPS